MSPIILFCLLISMLASTAVRNTSDTYYKNVINLRYLWKSEKNENLKIMLDYILSKQEFPPLIMSLVLADIRSDFADLISKYIASQSIVSYIITINDLSRRYAWQNRINLTWIFIIEDINDLKSLIYKYNHIWKAANQYLIIVTGQRTTMTTIMQQKIFQRIWKTYNVYKILVISIQDDFRCLSRYLPFEKDGQNAYGIVRKDCLIQNKGDSIDRLTLVATKTEMQTTMMKRSSSIELYDNFENLNGYPIRVIVFPSLMMDITFNNKDTKTQDPMFSGLDANAMLLLEKAMKAKFHIEIINRKNSSNDDPFHRTLHYLENGESEMSITSFFTQQYHKYKRYTFTTSVFEDKLCLIAPTAGFVPKSYMPIMPFALDLWIVLVIYNVLISILWFFVKYCSVSFRRHRPILLPLTRTRLIPSCYLVSNLPLTTHPYVSSCFDLIETSCYPLKEGNSSNGGGNYNGTTAQRAFLFGTLFFGLIVTGLYQSCLVSSLSKPYHYPELDTLEDVANSNFTIITKYLNLKQNTFTGNTTLDNKLKNKIKKFTSDKPTKDMVAFKKVIALSPYLSIKLDNLSNYYDEDGNELLHLVNECPVTYSMSYVVRLHSPYLERINKLLLRIQEAGLIELWYKNMTYTMYVAEQKRKMTWSGKRSKLTMEHYSLTFLGLLVGLFTCAFVFFTELYIAKKLGFRIFS